MHESNKSMGNELQAFLDARAFLWTHRTDLESASTFKWPQMTHFNWALDYFDPMAKGNSQPALRIIEEDGRETLRSFEEMSLASNRVANHLRGLGVKRHDHVLMILGNQVELWETMLASIKLGAVLIPATALLTIEDLEDRLQRGRVSHVIVESAQATKFESLSGDYTRICVGPCIAGWHDLGEAHSQSSSDFQADGPTLASDPMLLYFTSGTISKPKLVLHSHQSYPVGHLSTMYWMGLQRGDTHLTLASPGWAKLNRPGFELTPRSWTNFKGI